MHSPCAEDTRTTRRGNNRSTRDDDKSTTATHAIVSPMILCLLVVSLLSVERSMPPRGSSCGCIEGRILLYALGNFSRVPCVHYERLRDPGN